MKIFFGILVVAVVAIALTILLQVGPTPTPNPTPGPATPPVNPDKITLPAVPSATAIPTGSVVKIEPVPLYSSVDKDGYTIKIQVFKDPNAVSGVPVTVRSLPGPDGQTSSYIDAGPALSGVGRLVGKELEATTDPNADNAGVLEFKLKAIIAGADKLEIVVNPGGSIPGLQEVKETKDYETTL